MPATYAVVQVPLDAALKRQKVLAQGQAVDAVQVVRCPLGADVSVRIGQNSDAIPFAQGDGWVDLCSDTGGVWLDVGTASPGDTVTFLIFFTGGGSPVRSEL